MDEDMKEADFNHLLIDVQNLDTEKLKEVLAVCENTIKEREA